MNQVATLLGVGCTENNDGPDPRVLAPSQGRILESVAQANPGDARQHTLK